MVPFGMQAPRLRRVVRQACNDVGKRAELNLMGSEAELDRTVLDRIMAPLEHMLRNAVAHGIEDPEARRARGKDESGTINIELSKEGSEVVLTVADDGAGIDLDAVRAKAISRGLLKADAPVSEQVLLDMILESGFSTAEEVTQVAGRGVGMDVVASELKQLGGTFAIETKSGAGTKFTVRLPLTLSITQALMVGLSDDIYALPLLSVEGIERISHEDLEALYEADNPVYNWVGQDYRFLNLGRMMGSGDAPLPGPGKKAPLLLVRSGDYRAALHVSALMGSREVVVKSVGPQLATLRGVSGATITGDGSVVLILDLAVLVRHGLTQVLPQMVDETAAPAEAAAEAPTVMVVDDSITVRKVTTRLLERHGMNVVTAKDGVDALATLQEVTPDIMLLDIEMPRMDGFELATNVRNDERLKSVPIIMITSRTGEKHQERAKKIGVNRYMGKPFQETELFETIEELLGSKVQH
jgi:chemosensory pili system protein ChpA (sensor histidine kinase/response regulator)